MLYPFRFAAKLARAFKSRSTIEQLFILGVLMIAVGAGLHSLPAGLVTLGAITSVTTWRLGMLPEPPEGGSA